MNPVEYKHYSSKIIEKSYLFPFFISYKLSSHRGSINSQTQLPFIEKTTTKETREHKHTSHTHTRATLLSEQKQLLESLRILHA